MLLVSNTDAQTRDPAARPKATSRISGRILAADTGQPLRRAIVRLLSAEQHESRSTALTDPPGRYQFNNLPEGRYSLTAAKSGYVTLQYGQPVRMARVTGRLTFDASGQVPEPQSVRLFVDPEDGDPMDVLAGVGSAVINDDFSFEMVAPPGHVRIRAAWSGQASAWTLNA